MGCCCRGPAPRTCVPFNRIDCICARQPPLLSAVDCFCLFISNMCYKTWQRPRVKRRLSLQKRPQVNIFLRGIKQWHWLCRCFLPRTRSFSKQHRCLCSGCDSKKKLVLVSQHTGMLERSGDYTVYRKRWKWVIKASVSVSPLNLLTPNVRGTNYIYICLLKKTCVTASSSTAFWMS